MAPGKRSARSAASRSRSSGVLTRPAMVPNSDGPAGRMTAAASPERAPVEESPGSTETRCRVMPGGGNPRESATENKPPRRRCPAGKGETVRQERTAGPATERARQTPPGARPNRDGTGFGPSRVSGSPSGLVARGMRRRMSQMNGHPALWGGQNPAYRPAGILSLVPLENRRNRLLSASRAEFGKDINHLFAMSDPGAR
jgi:hypothetical protein